ncbi:MAG: hypothetical protein ACOYI5_08690 [Christensenellales bacterium]|jgi:hypothetical protein
MARKRITERDLLGFQTRAEALSREVEAKYEEMDRRKQAEPEPVRALGLLLLHDTEADVNQLARFAGRMERAGHAVEMPELVRIAPRDPLDRTPEWQHRHGRAQGGYLQLKPRARRIVAIGTGRSSPLAALMAEQYPIDALITVGGGLRTRRGARSRKPGQSADLRIARIARGNLYMIVCPVLTIVPEDCGAFTAQSASMYATDTRSDDVRRLDLPGANVETVWEAREEEIAEAVSAFLAEL